MIRPKSAFGAMVFAACLAACPVQARAGGEISTTFDVTLDVANQCTLAATMVDFGNTLADSGIELIAGSTLSVQCNFATAYTITLDGGRHGTAANRRMVSNAGNAIGYRLYSSTGNCNAANNAPWGDGSGGTCVLSASHDGNGVEQDVPVEGRLTLSNPPAGIYTDTVTATITY